MSALLEGNKEYQAVTVMRVDWDLFRDDKVSKDLNVRRQSTLVMFKGGEEIGRAIGQTSAAAIEPLFADAVAG